MQNETNPETFHYRFDRYKPPGLYLETFRINRVTLQVLRDGSRTYFMLQVD